MNAPAMNGPHYPVIGFGGMAGSGKTSAMESLALTLKTAGFHVLTSNFADPLKYMLQTLGVPHASLYGSPEEKERPLPEFQGRSGRFLMQTLGTEWGRQIVGDRLWAEAWKARAVRFLENRDGAHRMVPRFPDPPRPVRPIVLVGDVRFQSEIDAIHDLGGRVICIFKEQPPVHPASATAQHVSESQIISLTRHDLNVVNDCPNGDVWRGHWRDPEAVWFPYVYKPLPAPLAPDLEPAA